MKLYQVFIYIMHLMLVILKLFCHAKNPIDVRKLVSEEILTSEVIANAARTVNLKTGKVVTTHSGRKVSPLSQIRTVFQP